MIYAGVRCPPVSGSDGNRRESRIHRRGRAPHQIQTTGFASCPPSQRWKRYWRSGYVFSMAAWDKRTSCVEKVAPPAELQTTVDRVLWEARTDGGYSVPP
jgi:hypothetical protein